MIFDLSTATESPNGVNCPEKLRIQNNFGTYYGYKIIGVLDETFNGNYVAQIKLAGNDWYEINDMNAATKERKIEFSKQNKCRKLAFYERE